MENAIPSKRGDRITAMASWLRGATLQRATLQYTDLYAGYSEEYEIDSIQAYIIGSHIIQYINYRKQTSTYQASQ